MKKVLLSAFACYPNSGSEPYVGWNWQSMYPEDFKVYVLTRTFNRKHIVGNELEGVEYYYFDLPGFKNKDHYWKWIKLYYLFWQFSVLFYVYYINIREKFFIAHHITYNNMDVCGFLWMIPGVKFIWGPVGGGQVPPSSLRQIYFRSWNKQKIRSFIKLFGKYNPITLLGVWRSILVMYANEETKNALNSIVKHRCELFLETGIDDARVSIGHRTIEMFFNKLLWVGRIEERKGLTLALDVVCELKERNLNPIVTIVGSGPESEYIKDRIKYLQIEANVILKGAVDFFEIDALYKKSSVFMFTSVQDTSGNVILESLAAGLPVISLNHQGAKGILSNGGGVLIDIDEYDVVVKEYADAIERLASSNLLYADLSHQAIFNALNFHTWSMRRKIFSDMLERALAND